VSWPVHARRWSGDDIAADVRAASDEFRGRRLAEPLARYLAAFDASAAPVDEVLSSLVGGALVPRAGAGGWAHVWASEAGREAFRYLSAPPISNDDLETLAATALAPTAATDRVRRERLLDVMRAILDPRRFPWIAAGRMPRPHELKAAALATSTLIASQRVQTLRRGDEKAMVEGAVKGLLVGMGWQLASTRPVGGVQNLLNDSPLPRTFLTQINLGADNADVLIRLDDGRLLAIECKGSNSEINSRKRLNKEAAQNARAWLQRFGSQVVPGVALQGVFNPRYVVEAQDTPLVVFWGHRLEDLRLFVESCRL
jgi:XamI restriction endonuclease